jgi:hypothetical protein
LSFAKQFLETVWKVARGLVGRGFWQHKMTK